VLRILSGIKDLKKRMKHLSRLVSKRFHPVPDDPVVFCEKYLGFKPTNYQIRLLRDSSKRVVVRWCRQAGKTHTLAAYALWFALKYPKSTVLIVSPSLRQSIILRDKIQSHINSIPEEIRRGWIARALRTTIYLKNNSRIVALPCNPDTVRGYTANLIIADEAAFFRDDETMFLNVFTPMLATTAGKLIVSSTPWGSNNMFYRFCHSERWSQHHITWREALAEGIYKQDMVEEVEEVARTYPQRYKMEYEAEFVEDVDVWLTQDLLARCITTEEEFFDFHREYRNLLLFGGVDFGKEVDYSVVAVVRVDNEDRKHLVYCHRFPLKTSYAAVIGHVKVLCERWDISLVCADKTGVGDYIVEDMTRAGIPVEGITFTTERKEQMATYLREEMLAGRFLMPFDRRIISELNVERYELSKDGRVRFSHPEGTHDDIFWAIALAMWAAKLGGTAGIRKTRSIF